MGTSGKMPDAEMLNEVRDTVRAMSGECDASTQANVGLIQEKDYKFPLIEKLGKKRTHHVEHVERLTRLIGILRAHPEFEAYQDFQDLMRRYW